MHENVSIIAVLALLGVGVACTKQSVDEAGSEEAGGVQGNVLLAEWTGPYGGVPAFDKMGLVSCAVSNFT